MTDGDFQKLDYLQDCSWFEYMYRKQQFGQYCDWKAKQLENLKSK